MRKIFTSTYPTPDDTDSYAQIGDGADYPWGRKLSYPRMPRLRVETLKSKSERLGYLLETGVRKVSRLFLIWIPVFTGMTKEVGLSVTGMNLLE